MTICKDDLVNRICVELDALYRDPNYENGNFGTPAVLTALCQVCKAHYPASYLYSRTTGGVPTLGEWLYDFVCLTYDDELYLKNIPLVAECEWGDKRKIWDDFQKLLLVRTDIRVMVFGRYAFRQNEDPFEELAKYICKCDRTQAGDTYLLAAWTNDNFQYRRIDAYQYHHVVIGDPTRL